MAVERDIESKRRRESWRLRESKRESEVCVWEEDEEDEEGGGGASICVQASGHVLL